MKKLLIALVLLLALAIAIPTFAADNTAFVCVLVHHSISNQISTEINRYVADLATEGLDAKVVVWNGEDPSFPYAGNACLAVRTLLQSEYAQGMIGVLLVGDIPTAWYEYDYWEDERWKHDEFITDYFYMDLNGVWEDTDNDHHYVQTGGHKGPEIWVGRLKASHMTGDEVSLLKNYFDKNHAYRTGTLQLPFRALMYVDDDWVPWASDLDTHIGNVFSNRTLITDKHITNATDYLIRLQQQHYLVHVKVHGSDDGHGFEIPGILHLDPVTTLDIKSTDPQAFFYFLYSCKNARYSAKDYVAGWYIFSDTHGVAAIAETRSGSFFYQNTFYEKLKEHSIGISMKEWYKRVTDYGNIGQYGWTIIGDPTLKVKPSDTTAPTTTITVSGTEGDNDWFTSDVTVSLSATDDVSGVDKTEYSFDGTTWTAYTTPFPVTDEGEFQVHYRSRDKAGNIEKTKIETIKIDKTSPKTIITVNGVEGDNDWFTSDVTVSLSATDDVSGVDKTEYSFDEAVWNVYSTPFLITDEGQIHIYYRSIDKAGHIETETEKTKIDKTAPHGSIVINEEKDYSPITSVTLTLTATDDTSGVYEVRYSNDQVWNKSWETFETTKTWVLTEGDETKTVYYQIKDKAGHVSNTYSDLIVLDSTPPNISVTSPSNKLYNVTYVPLAFTVNEPAIWISYSLDGAVNLTISGNIILSELSKGVHTITVYAQDYAGNVGSSATVNFYINTHQEKPIEQEENPLTILGGVAIATITVAGALYFIKKKARRATPPTTNKTIPTVPRSTPPSPGGTGGSGPTVPSREAEAVHPS